LYFNNATQTLMLSTFSKENEKVEIQIFDVTGRFLMQDSFTATIGFNKREVFSGDLSSGIYLVRLQTDGGAITKKLVVR